MTIADDPVHRDVSAIQSKDWPVRSLTAFQGFREDRFQVVFAQSVLDEMHLHGQGSTEIEVCGVLIGTGYRDSHGPYLLVEHCIRGNGARTKATNVTFTAETWAHIQGVMDERYEDKKMIGWYHTHPGFGIFLSDMDLFICDNFFNLPWQVAFVYDPVSGEEGNFTWRGGRPTREPILIEDDVTPKAAAVPLIDKQDAAKTGDPLEELHQDAKILELMIRVRRLEKRQKALVTALAFLAAFVIMWEVEFAPVPSVTVVKLPAATQPAGPTARTSQTVPSVQQK